jgi:hypothetical protein
MAAGDEGVALVFSQTRGHRYPLTFWLVITAMAVQLGTVFYYLQSARYADRIFAFHNRVLAGSAPAYGQYQCYFHDHILRLAWSHLPRTGEGAWLYTHLFVAYYSVGTLLFAAAFYRFLRRFGSDSSVSFAMLYLAAVYPLFWYDSSYHPGDAWGMLLAVLTMEQLLQGKRSWAYHGLLLLSGFTWEKHLLLPVSVGVADATARKRWLPTVLGVVAGLLLAAIGQLLPRIICGTDRPVSGPTLQQNLQGVPLWALGMVILYAVPVYWTVTRRRQVPALLVAAATQLAVWPLIYLAIGGVLKEMRGPMISVVYTWPMFVMAIDRMAVRAQPTSNVRPQRG